MIMEYWLYLHPYVYASIKKNTAILYNTLNGKLLEYCQEKMGMIYRLIRELNSDKNLYVVSIKDEEIDNHIKTFINDLRTYYLGDLINKEHRPQRPIQLKPVLSLQRTMEYFFSTVKGQNKILTRDELPDYLNVITIYINDGCSEACSFCDKAYKQFLCCTKSTNGEITVDLLRDLIDQTKNNNLYKLIITGGNIFRHSSLKRIVETLDSVSLIKEYYIHYKNVEEIPFFNGENNRLNIILNFPLDTQGLKRCLELSNRPGLKRKFRFIVQEIVDIEKAGEVASSFSIKDAELIPYFNGNNLDFFKQKVFLDKASIIQCRPSMNNILSRVAINTWDFKKLTLLSNGDVFANLNQPKIGNLNHVHIFDMVERELHQGKSWTKVRKYVKPCKSCVFNALCPPISNYEYAIGRYNLCNIM
jgi:pseudo-rSAM protein